MSHSQYIYDMLTTLHKTEKATTGSQYKIPPGLTMSARGLAQYSTY